MVNKINKSKLENIDNKILKRRNHLQKILSILHHSNISNANYDSSNKAFFSGNIESAFKMHNKPIEDVPNTVNRNILDIYKLLGDTEKEIYIGSWTIMSVKNAIKRYKELCNLTRTDILMLDINIWEWDI